VHDAKIVFPATGLGAYSYAAYTYPLITWDNGICHYRMVFCTQCLLRINTKVSKNEQNFLSLSSRKLDYRYANTREMLTLT